MSTTPDQIEAEVEANRANVESTLGALKDRLSVENIVNDATRFIGIEDTRGTLVAAGREIKADPVAFGMIGLGLALLATGATRRDPHRAQQFQRHRYDTSAHQGIGDRAQHYSDQASAKVSGYADAASRKLHDAQQAAHDGYDYARSQASDFQHRAGRQMESQPLLFGALALAAGAVIAAALPRTLVEDRWAGPGRDHLLDEAKHAAADLSERATAAVQAGYAAAVDTAKDEGLVPQGGDTLAAKVEHVASAAMESAKAKLENDPS